MSESSGMEGAARPETRKAGRGKRLVKRAGVLAVMCAVAAAVAVFAASTATVGSTANSATSGTVAIYGAEIATAPVNGDCTTLASSAYGPTAASAGFTVDLKSTNTASTVGRYCVRLSSFEELGKTQFAFGVKNVAATETGCSFGEGEAEAAGGGDGTAGAGDCGSVGELQGQVEWAGFIRAPATVGQCPAVLSVGSGFTTDSPLPVLGTGTSLQSAVVDHSNVIGDPGVFCVELALSTNSTSDTAVEAQTDTVTFDADIVVTNPVP